MVAASGLPAVLYSEIGQDFDSEGIFEDAVDFKLNSEAEKAVAEAKQFVAEALKQEEPK